LAFARAVLIHASSVLRGLITPRSATSGSIESPTVGIVPTANINLDKVESIIHGLATTLLPQSVLDSSIGVANRFADTVSTWHAYAGIVPFADSTVFDRATTKLTLNISNPAVSSLINTVPVVVPPITITDNLPSNLRIANSTVTLGAGCSSTSVPTVAAGATSFAVTAAQNVGVLATPTPTAVLCTITVNVTNVAGQQNASCATNPAAFTNGASSVTGIIATSNISNGVTNQCLIVTTPTANLTISKTDSKSNSVTGGTNDYVISLTNNGGSPANNAVITDVVGAGLSCPGTNSVTCTASSGAACPAGPLTIANLTGVGITIPTLPNTGNIQLAYTCNVN
jgi:uncharacterized repeat protein (TIGR01451 family)